MADPEDRPVDGLEGGPEAGPADRLEAGLAAALAQRAGEARPDPDAMVAGARRRRRERRTRAVLGAGAATTAALAAVPLTLTLTDPDSSANLTPGDPSPTADESVSWVPDGWRVESYRSVSWAVPEDWRYGTLDQWCTGGDEPDARSPYLQRPNGVSTQVACSPSRGYGVVVSDATWDEPLRIRPGEDVPADAVIDDVEVAGVRVTAVLPDRGLVERVLGTVHEYGDVDAHGCPATARVPAGQVVDDAMRELPRPDEDAGVSVCRYAVVRGTIGLLEQSERLDRDDSWRAWKAVADAPAGTGPDARKGTCGSSPEQQAVQLRVGDEVLAWVHYDGCDGHGVDTLGAGDRRLTADVMRWALSPGWSGGVTGGVPIGDRRP